MKISKRIIKLAITPYLAAWALLLLGRTWNIKIIGWDKINNLFKKGQAPIFCFWHGRLLALGYTFRKRRYAILSSESRDGQVSIRANRFLGYEVVGGSSTRGGTKGLRNVARLAKSGKVLGLTPDGPRGPAQKMHEGVLLAATASGNPLVPLAASASRGIRLSSWDKFLIPLPFSKVYINVGEPFYIPSKISREDRGKLRAEFENIMNKHLEDTDRIALRGGPAREVKTEE